MGVKSASVMVSNPAPHLALQGIADGGVVSGAITVSLTASSPNRISEMYVWLDGRLSALFSTGTGTFIIDSNYLSNGQHALDAMVEDMYGKEGRLQLFFQVRNDAPMVSLLLPADGSRVFGSLDIQVEVVCSRTTQVSLKVDDLVIGATSSPPYLFRMDSDLLSDGTHTISATAIDAYGKIGLAMITIVVDNAPPSIALSMLPQGTVVSGEVLLEPEVSAPNGVSSLILKLDGVVVSNDATAPYQYLIDTDLLANGAHLVEWKLVDRNGMSAEMSVSFKVLNLPPTVAMSVVEGIQHGTVDLTASVSGGSEPVMAWVEVDTVFLTNLVNGAFSIDTKQLSDGEHQLRVTAEDAHGRRGYSEINITVANAGPVVSILTPTAHGELSRNTTISLQVGGQWPLTTVSVYIDNILLGELHQGPWTWPLDISVLEEGTHVLRAMAIDSLGGAGNATIPFGTMILTPRVELGEPSGITGMIEVSISSNIPMSYVVYSLDDVEISNATAAPFSLTVDTSSYADGMHSLKARAVLDDGTSIQITKQVQMSAAKAPGNTWFLDFKDLDLIFLQVMIIVLLLAVVLGRARSRKK
jgi:hypothetical protein